MLAFSLLRPALMRMDEERAHKTVLNMLKRISRSRQLTTLEILLADRVPKLPVEHLGHTFSVPVGLAAGFDKDGIAFPALAGIGFGSIEIGTVTPRPQRGNPGQRIFRIPQDEAIINRMGFNSCGLDQLIVNLHAYRSFPKSAVLGINIGKNTDTPNQKAILDYVRCFDAVCKYADYISINVSSPNSPGLRDLQNFSELDELLMELAQKRTQYASEHGTVPVPIALKISPDLDTGQIHSIVESAGNREIDAIIATNTTTSRPENHAHQHYQQAGGLSGKPLSKMSTDVIRTIRQAAGDSMTIIGCGGISSAGDAWQKILAGADLVQVYSSMIFQGPIIVKQIVSGLVEYASGYDSNNFTEAVSAARQDNAHP